MKFAVSLLVALSLMGGVAPAQSKKSGSDNGAAAAAQQAAQERAQQEAQERAQQEAQQRAQQEAEQRAQQEAQQRAQQQAQQEAQQRAQQQAQQEAAQRAAQQQAQQEGQQRAQQQAQQEAAQRAAQQQAQQEAAQRAQQQAAQQAAQQKAQQEASQRAQQQAAQAAQQKAQQDAANKAQQDAANKAAQAAQQKAQQDAANKAAQAAQQKAQQDAANKAAQAAQQKAQQDAANKAAQAAQQKAQQDAANKAAQAAQQKAQQDAANKTAQQKAQQDAANKAAQAAQQKAQQDAANKAAQQKQTPKTPEQAKLNPPKVEAPKQTVTTPKLATISEAQRTQKQQQLKAQEQASTQQKQTQTAQIKAQNPKIAAKIPAGAIATPTKNGVTIHNPKTNTTTIVDKTGKTRATFTKNTGSPIFTPKTGVQTVTKGNQTLKTGKGFNQTITRDPRTNEIKSNVVTTRGTTIERNYVNKTTYVTKNTVIIKNKTIIINENRNYVTRYYGGALVPVYTPRWWGRPAVMYDGWVIGSHHIYGEFFAFNMVAGYYSPWWAGNAFVVWNNPYACDFGNCWHNYYSRWGWGWADAGYYNGFYTPRYSYSSLGWFLADYYYQRELENAYRYREAQEADAEYDAAAADQDFDNGVAEGVLNPTDTATSDDIESDLASQSQYVADSLQSGTQLYAADIVADGSNDIGHLFTVDSTLNETTTGNDGNTYDCELTAADVVQRDASVDLDTEPAYEDDGVTPQVDDDGNQVYITYVTMQVVHAKRGSCINGSDVVIQMDTLQDMLSEEIARDQEGIEQAVDLGINP